jgi:hypothetical protein
LPGPLATPAGLVSGFGMEKAVGGDDADCRRPNCNGPATGDLTAGDLTANGSATGDLKTKHLLEGSEERLP